MQKAARHRKQTTTDENGVSFEKTPFTFGSENPSVQTLLRSIYVSSVVHPRHVHEDVAGLFDTLAEAHRLYVVAHLGWTAYLSNEKTARHVRFRFTSVDAMRFIVQGTFQKQVHIMKAMLEEGGWWGEDDADPSSTNGGSRGYEQSSSAMSTVSAQERADVMDRIIAFFEDNAVVYDADFTFPDPTASCLSCQVDTFDVFAADPEKNRSAFPIVQAAWFKAMYHERLFTHLYYDRRTKFSDAKRRACYLIRVEAALNEAVRPDPGPSGRPS